MRCVLCHVFLFPGVYWSVRAFFVVDEIIGERRNEIFYSSEFELYLVVLADVERAQKFHLVA